MTDERQVFSVGPDSGLPPAVRAFRTALILGRRLQVAMDETLQPAGVTTQQAAVVTAVIALGAPSLAETAAAVGSTRQNVAQIVDALVRKGLLTSEPDPADSRRRVLRATEANAAFWGERDPADHAAVARWFSDLEPDELETFCALADRVLERLARDDARGRS